MAKIVLTAFGATLSLMALFMGIMIYDAGPTETTRESIRQATQTFTDTVRQKGYVDPRDYEVFSKIITSYGAFVTVDLEHHKKRYQPLYDSPNDFGTFEDEFEVLYEGFFTTDILKVLYPDTDIPIESTSRRYNMNLGDFFIAYVKVQPSIGERLKATIFNSVAPTFIQPFGGLVRDES